MKSFVFFTMNDFQKEGGGTIRMLGIINELAKTESKIILISNLKDTSKVDANIQHISINYEFSREDKRKFQFILGLFGYKKLNSDFSQFLERLRAVFDSLENKNNRYFFLEYLDNSIAYWLKKNKIIPGYINDIHGIASNEFDFQAKKTKSLPKKLFLRTKEKISNRLDKKVFDEADGIIYASKAMEDYFKTKYPSLHQKNNIYLPYVLNSKNVKPANFDIINKIKENIHWKEDDFIFLFAGAFKETGGIQDLIIAFDKVAEKYTYAKLLIVGDGPTFEQCKTLKENSKNSNKMYLLGRQPYDYLASFQEVSHAIVCPDRQNLFSELIVHVKYLDALLSEKIVINGAFRSVKEINEQKELSLLFIPSDIDDLRNKMILAIEDYEKLSTQYQDSKKYALEHLTYTNYIHHLAK